MKNNMACPLIPITELLECIVDNRGKSCPTSESGFPLIATNCIKHTSIYPTFENVRYVSEDTLKNWFRAELKPNDILFVNKGTPGRVCLVPDPVTFCAAQDMIGLRVNPDKIYYKYLFAVLRSDYIQKKIANFHVGIAIPHFKKSDMDNLLIPVPDMDYQIKIGNLYCELSEKIEVNYKTNNTLENITQLVYNYWFLQYNFPDENGNPYKSSGGKMVWNETLNREIPLGWEVKKIGELFTSERGLSYSTANIETGNGVPMINLANFRPGGGAYKSDGLKHYWGDYPQGKVLKPYELVMCNTQQTSVNFATDIIGRAMLVPDIFEGDIVSSHHVNVIRPNTDELKYFLLYLFNADFFHKYISGYTNGTNILGLTFSGVENYTCEIPEEKLLERFASMVLDVEKKKSEILKENIELSKLRDFLLPMLLSGQVGFSRS